MTNGASVGLWDLNLSLSSNTSNDGGVLVTLMSDTGNAPGSVIGTIGFVSDAAANNPTTFSGVTFGLSASTAYWIMLTDVYDFECTSECATTAATTIQWDVTASLTDSTNGTSPGTRWTYSDDSPWSPGDPTPFIMGVSYETAEPAPEPATLMLLGAGLLGLGIANRRKNRRA